MCSAESLREFIQERLAAVCQQIFCEVQKTIVQYEEEIQRQRRLLDISRRPDTHSHGSGTDTCAELRFLSVDEDMKARQRLRDFSDVSWEQKAVTLVINLISESNLCKISDTGHQLKTAVRCVWLFFTVVLKQSVQFEFICEIIV